MTINLSPAPDFSLPRDGGDHITLSAHRPAPVVLFFYPKDDTPGCTTESIDFSQSLPEFHAKGASVFGISRDPVTKHEKFRDKHGLTVPLLSDEAGTTCEDYGVWVEKNMYGKKFFGIERSTFLINGDGLIVREWRKVKVKGHVAEVLDAVRAL